MKTLVSYMSFNINNIENIIARERLNMTKVENINNTIQQMLKHIQQSLYKACKIMFK